MLVASISNQLVLDNNSEDGKVTVNLTMTSEGSNKWSTMTSNNNVGKAIAITMDDIVYSAPQVNGPISGGNTEISGRLHHG